MVRKFRTSKATLHKTKKTAEKKAKSLRNQGYRAEVHPSQKATRKKSPSLKWTVLKGQLRKKVLPTKAEKRRALKKLDNEYAALKSRTTDRQMLNNYKTRYNREKKRLNAIPSR